MKKILFFALLFFVIVSCNKYENGPSFSLLSKKSRVVGDWKLKETLLNDQAFSVNNNVLSNTYSFTKQNEYIISGMANQNQPSEQKGTWAFGDKKETLITVVDGVTDTWDISRLKNKSLWLKKELSNGTLMYKYEQD